MVFYREIISRYSSSNNSRRSESEIGRETIHRFPVLSACKNNWRKVQRIMASSAKKFVFKTGLFLCKG